jgi:hypothetical protein
MEEGEESVVVCVLVCSTYYTDGYLLELTVVVCWLWFISTHD